MDYKNKQNLPSCNTICDHTINLESTTRNIGNENYIEDKECPRSANIDQVCTPEPEQLDNHHNDTESNASSVIRESNSCVESNIIDTPVCSSRNADLLETCITPPASTTCNADNRNSSTIINNADKYALEAIRDKLSVDEDCNFLSPSGEKLSADLQKIFGMLAEHYDYVNSYENT